jgi:hypothetical protein
VPAGLSARVRVLNATGIHGLAARVAHTLRAGGFPVADVGNAPRLGVRDTVVMYPPALAADARAIGQALSPESEGATLRLLPTGRGDTITVTLGGPYAAAPSTAGTPSTAGIAAAVPTATATPTPATGDSAVVPDRVASQDPCSGSQSSQ